MLNLTIYRKILCVTLQKFELSYFENMVMSEVRQKKNENLVPIQFDSYEI